MFFSIHIYIWWASDLITRPLFCLSLLEPHYVQKRYWPSLTQGCCFGPVPPASQRVTEVTSFPSTSPPSLLINPFLNVVVASSLSHEMWDHYLVSMLCVQSLRPCARTPIPSWLWSCWRTAKWQLLGDWRGWSSLRILSTSWPSSWRQTRHISCLND